MNDIQFTKQTIQLLKMALAEDIGSGDCTSSLFFSENDRGTFSLIAKGDGIICGLPLAKSIFALLEAGVDIDWHTQEGQKVKACQSLCRLTGKTRSILQGERVFLNLVQRLSGIATQTHEYVQRVAPFGVTILDTRKTMPLWRELDKYAVRIGGGQNHRMGLFDMVLIKENHINAAGGIEQALERVKEHAREDDLPVEIEVRNLEEFARVYLYADSIDRIMLDNMSPSDIRRAVQKNILNIELEASGGISRNNIEEYASTGVHYISLGEITHSIKAVDVSLLFFQ